MPMNGKNRRIRKRTIAWRFWAILIVGVAAILPLYSMRLMEGATRHPPVVSFAGLIDSNGQVLGDPVFDHRFKLVFFGFTECASVCPLTLVKVRAILGAAGATTSASLAPVFISLDPEHDQPAVLKAYTAAIDPRIIGITGDIKHIDQLVEAYGGSVLRRRSQSGPLAIDHTARLYLIAPDNRLLSSYDADESPRTIAADIALWTRG
jgi:protein SCO1/2